MTLFTKSDTNVRVVCDTNVIISAFLVEEGAPSIILNLILSEKIINYTSHPLHDELLDVLSREKVRKRIHTQKLFQLIESFEKKFVRVIPTQQPRVVHSDPDDDIVIACALAADVHFIISGDPHLLAVRHYLHIKIVTPREFLTYYFQNYY